MLPPDDLIISANLVQLASIYQSQASVIQFSLVERVFGGLEPKAVVGGLLTVANDVVLMGQGPCSKPVWGRCAFLPQSLRPVAHLEERAKQSNH